MGIGHPDAVRANKADPVGAGDFAGSDFQGCPLGACFAEPAGGNDDRADAALPAFLENPRDEGRRRQQDRQVDRVGHIGDGRVDRPAEQGVALGIDKMDGACVAAQNEVARQSKPELGWVARVLR